MEKKIIKLHKVALLKDSPKPIKCSWNLTWYLELRPQLLRTTLQNLLFISGWRCCIPLLVFFFFLFCFYIYIKSLPSWMNDGMPVITARIMHPGKDILVTWRSRGTYHTLKGHIKLLNITKSCQWRSKLLWYGPFPTRNQAEIKSPWKLISEVHLN